MLTAINWYTYVNFIIVTSAFWAGKDPPYWLPILFNISNQYDKDSWEDDDFLLWIFIKMICRFLRGKNIENGTVGYDCSQTLQTFDYSCRKKAEYSSDMYGLQQ